MRCRRSLVLAAGCCCCCHRCCQLRWGRLCPGWTPGVRLVTARTVKGMDPYPGQARCLALGFRPECFWRLDVKGGRRPFPEETRSALDVEGKHVTIQGPSLDRGQPGLLHLPPRVTRSRSLRSVDQWKASGECAGVRIGRSWSISCPALAPVSGVVLPVCEKVVRELGMGLARRRSGHLDTNLGQDEKRSVQALC
jgi:hypothetical protein